VGGKSGQQVGGKSGQSVVEKYARVPDSVLRDDALSASARCVYAVLARYTFQGHDSEYRASAYRRHLGTPQRDCRHRDSRTGRGKAHCDQGQG
jgi:hypothetical protein